MSTDNYFLRENTIRPIIIFVKNRPITKKIDGLLIFVEKKISTDY